MRPLLCCCMAGLHDRKAAARALIQALAPLLLLALRSAAHSNAAAASRGSRPAAGVAAVLQVVRGRDAAWLVGALIAAIQAAVVCIP